MINEIFQSVNESIKRRNNPEDFLPKNSIDKEIIHRGYIKNAQFPIRYSFIPDGKGNVNSGLHIYNFKDKNINGVVEISHKYSPSMSGHETKSHIQFEYLGSDKLDSIDLHRMVLPIINHHVKSHNPDVFSFSKSIKNADDIVRRLGSSYISTKGEHSTIAKKIIDPKTDRILKHIKKKLNTNKE